VGLIGDDIHAVARQMQEKLGITVFANSCEGYKACPSPPATTSPTTRS
jgi:nitrogenase molybdenum-iron protein alpha/beta subunit